MTQNVYEGYRNSRFRVLKNGTELSPERSLKVRSHSPDGPSWGYCGSGPAQCALMLLLEETDEATAQRLYQDFKAGVVAGWSQARGWTITSDEIRAWLARQPGQAVDVLPDAPGTDGDPMAYS